MKRPKLFGGENGRRSFGKIPLIAVLCLAVVVGGILFLKSCGEDGPEVTPTPSAAATQAIVSTTPSTPTPTAAATPSPGQTGRVGSIVKFGHYEQDNNTANGTEELEWVILAEQDDSFLLLSRYVLDNRTDGSAYTDLTWEDNDNRIWLNMTFLDEAFTAEEQQKILTTTLRDSAEEKMGVWEPIRGQDCEDQIFLLSCTEVKKYLPEEDDRRCQPTAYAKSRGLYPASDGNCVWWLRTFSVYNNGNGAATIRENGKFGWVDVDTGNQCGIRPAFWIRWS